MGEIYLRQQRFEEAETLFTKTLNLVPRNTPDHMLTLVLQALCRIRSGKPEAARVYLDKVQTTETDRSLWYGPAWEGLIYAYQALGDLDTAEKHAREWTVIQPEAPSPHSTLAGIYARQNKWDEALVEWSRTIDLDPRTLLRTALIAKTGRTLSFVSVGTMKLVPNLRRSLIC